MAGLNCLSPTEEPHVSTHMDHIRDRITQKKDGAYVVDGDVYFSVDKFPSYGKLSGHTVEEDNRAGERVAMEYSKKRNPTDFALWKDLIFPHHENALAQSCAACEDANIGHWVHNGFVTMNDVKMSNSLGNFFTIREVGLP
ncbi:hypothetical protein Dimus_031125 [Dionaea muscipula]